MISVSPLAGVAAIIVVMVAPTEDEPNTMRAPVRPFGALASMVPASSEMVAPRVARALMCRSTGLAPMAQPPGIDTRAWPKRASSGPSTRIVARIRRTMS